ncbi:MAG TPA: nitroreductase family protein, partial [Candidatus Kapabacteria bacterium]|nr:nitroreductase family protein [Candidatus Kapabacteria bacterium]
MSETDSKVESQSSFLEDLKETLRRGKTIDGYDYNVKKRYYEPAPESSYGDEFRQVVESRRSVRKFTDRKIPRDVLDACLDLALLAP